MKRTSLLLFALLLGCLSAYAQQGVRSLGGVELGLRNALYYEQALSTRSTVRAHIGCFVNAGYVFNAGDRGFYYNGIVPTIGLQGRWYHSAKKYAGTNNNGGFLGLGIDYFWYKHTFLTDTPPSRFDVGVISLTPGWGYNRDLTDRLSLQFFSGFSINWLVKEYVSYEIQWQYYSVPLAIELGISYRL